MRLPVCRVVVGLALSSFFCLMPLRGQLILPKKGEALPTFEVATIKPAPADARNMGEEATLDGWRLDNVRLDQIIRGAYNAVSDAQLVGGPQALLNQHFDVLAKMDPEDVAKYKALSQKDRERRMDLMEQALLRDRFHLKMHLEMRELPVYILVVAKGGPKLQPSAPVSPSPAPQPDSGAQPPRLPDQLPHHPPPGTRMMRMNATRAEMSISGGTMEELAGMLTQQTETARRLVLDKTGLTGKYDWYLEWTPARAEMESRGADGSSPVSDAPGLITALREQLGLRLESHKEPVQIVVIDRLDPPSPN